jgi:hypothetical protein
MSSYSSAMASGAARHPDVDATLYLRDEVEGAASGLRSRLRLRQELTMARIHARVRREPGGGSPRGACGWVRAEAPGDRGAGGAAPSM